MKQTAYAFYRKDELTTICVGIHQILLPKHNFDAAEDYSFVVLLLVQF